MINQVFRKIISRIINNENKSLLAAFSVINNTGKSIYMIIVVIGISEPLTTTDKWGCNMKRKNSNLFRSWVEALDAASETEPYTHIGAPQEWMWP